MTRAQTRGSAACSSGSTWRRSWEERPRCTPLLTRYVSLGNSLTAGIQSGGLTDSLQLRAYPVLIARQAVVKKAA